MLYKKKNFYVRARSDASARRTIRRVHVDLCPASYFFLIVVVFTARRADHHERLNSYCKRTKKRLYPIRHTHARARAIDFGVLNRREGHLHLRTLYTECDRRVAPVRNTCTGWL